MEYHSNFYGLMVGINGGLPSDRLVVEWDLVSQPSVGAESIEIVVPPVTAEEIAAAAAHAFTARLALRNAMEPLLGDGWLVTDVDRANRTYTLSR